MSKAQKMVQIMDQLQITLKPYVPHYLQEFDQPVRGLYLQMLYSVISLSNLNNAQNRVWELLSQSIAAVDISTDEMGIELIKNFALDTIAKKLEHCFMLDLLVLIRLNSVSKDQAKVVAELMSLLKLKDADMATLLHLSNLILKIEDKVQNLVDFEYQSVRHWHEFSYRVLTKQILTESFIPGNWLLTQDIEDITKTVEIQDSNFSCLGDTFKIITEEARVRVENCAFTSNFTIGNCDAIFNNSQFFNIDMCIKGKSIKNKVIFESCHFTNSFEVSDNSPAYFNLYGGTVEFKTCQFELLNQTALYVRITITDLLITGCHFTKCGNPLKMGAVNSLSNHIRVIDSTFDHCVSKVSGAAIRIQAQTDSDDLDTGILIEGSHFTNNKSEEILKEGLQGSSVHIDYATSYFYGSKILEPIIQKCDFTTSNIILKLSQWRGRALKNTIGNCNFEQSQVYSLPGTEIIFDACNFNNQKLENVVEIEE